MLRSISSRLALLVLVAGVMWGCDGDRATQPQPSGKAAADGLAVVVVTVQQDGAPVSGVVVELSRSIAGLAANYEWSATTDENGQARIEVTSSGYYQARVVQDGHEVGYQSSIPLNVGTEFALNLTIAALVPADDPRALTQAYVEAGIDRYERDGREATLAYYNSPESIEGERGMMIVRESDHTLLASAIFPQLIGSNTMFAPGTPIGLILLETTTEGYSAESFAVDPATGQEVPIWVFAIRRDDLVFASSHTIIRADLAGATLDYVQKAIELYDREGLDATVAYYDSRESVDGQFYLFLIGADDLYLAHPIFPHLKGTDIKDVVDSSGYELGKEIAAATGAGHWVDYLWPSPVTGHEEPKSAWVIRHDGLIFASGYYTPDLGSEPPAWKGADPREYTVAYVEKAIARYKRDGLEALKNYYNSVAGFEGQWYLFATDANDIYIVHGLLRNLIGKDIKTVQSSDNPNLGKEIAAATEEGIWVDYLWPHPITLQEVPKVAYAKRYDGLVFASGYYPEVADPRAYTQAYVADAIAYYDANGLKATVAYYSSEESIDGQWSLVMGEENKEYLVGRSAGGPVPAWFTATEEGQWIQRPFSDPRTPGNDMAHIWAVRHDGLIFSSAYFTSE